MSHCYKLLVCVALKWFYLIGIMLARFLMKNDSNKYLVSLTQCTINRWLIEHFTFNKFVRHELRIDKVYDKSERIGRERACVFAPLYTTTNCQKKAGSAIAERGCSQPGPIGDYAIWYMWNCTDIQHVQLCMPRLVQYRHSCYLPCLILWHYYFSCPWR